MILTTILIAYGLVSIAAYALFGMLGYARGPVRTNHKPAGDPRFADRASVPARNRCGDAEEIWTSFHSDHRPREPRRNHG